MNRSRHWLKIPLIILVLSTIQIVQASPLHDHLDHVAGCVLCHYNGTSHAITVVNNHGPLAKTHPVNPTACYSLITATAATAFQGRAPPLSFQ